MVIYRESFETDGQGTRYKVQNGSDDGIGDYFARRRANSPEVIAKGGTYDGEWHWGIEDLDGDGVPVDDLIANQARLWLQPFSIVGYRDLELVVAVGAHAQMEFDDCIMFQYRIDGNSDWQTLGEGTAPGRWTTRDKEATWTTVGGFRGRHTDSPGWYFEGDQTTWPPIGNPRATRTFQDFSWRIWGIGETMELRIYAKSNGGNEEYHVDNIRIIGESTETIGSIYAALNKDRFVESAGAGAGQLTLTIAPPAPAGGLSVNIITSDLYKENIAIPESIAIPEGQTGLVIPFDIVHDGRFNGDPVFRVKLTAEGYGRNEVTYQIDNVDPRPRLLITEVHPAVAGGSPDRYVGLGHYSDTNGDGWRNERHDEFIEIINLDTVPVELSDWYTTDDLGKRHIIPRPTILQPGEVLVIFGGGRPTGRFGGAQIQVSSTGNLGWGDSGDNASILASGAVVREVVFSGVLSNTLESLVIPDALIPTLGYAIDEGAQTDNQGRPTGNYVKMSDVHPDSGPPRPADPLTDTGTGAGPFFSPGLRNDGSGLPLMQWDNEITLTLASDEAVPGIDPIPTLAVPEGAPFTVTITLTEDAPVGGITVNLSAIDVNAILPAVAPTRELIEIKQQNLAGAKVSFEQTSVVVNGRGPVVVQGYTRMLDQPDGNLVASIRAHSSTPGVRVLFGLAELEIIDMTFDPTSVVINEALVGVTGLGLDPNLNGEKEEAVEDQFVEFINTSPGTINLSGWRLYSWWTGNLSNEELVHIFPAGTYLNPAEAILVFGGGDESVLNAASAASFGGARVQVANSGYNGINMREDNKAGIVQLQNQYGKVKNTVYWPASLSGQAMSLVRDPDITGIWADTITTDAGLYPKLHFDISPDFSLFSAGKRIDGQAFSGNGLPVISITAVYRHADLYDWSGYTFSSTYGILDTRAWPWAYHYDLNLWFLPVLGTTTPDDDDAMFLYDAAGQKWIYTRESIYPAYFDYDSGTMRRFD
jgi:hypothetical protein